MGQTLQRYKPRNGHFFLLTFFVGLIAAAALFVPFIVYQGGVFYYYGDFNVQEIPFYQMLHFQVKSGDLGWNHLTDLGTDTIASYSFYTLGSPFFWLTIPFDNEFVPNLIGPLLILKFACASAAAYLYLQRYVEYKPFAVMGGVLYAFSGFSIYNVFFFHFHEPMIMFPLLLAALDTFLFDKRRGIFAVAVFAACVVNYYFFVGQVLFVIMYFLMVTLTKTYKFKITEFLLLALEVAIGFAASAFILLPSVLGLLGNPRLDTLPKDWDALVHDRPQRYWLAVLAFFFPADMPAMPTFTPESNCKWASVAGWLPLFGMTGVIAYLQLKKRDWIKKLICLLILFAFVPVLNSMFQMLNSSIYYTRWYYMLVLIFVLATVRAVENKRTNWTRALIWSSGITLGATLLIGLMPHLVESETGEEDTFEIGVEGDSIRFWLYALAAMMCLLALALLYKKYLKNRLTFFVAAGSTVLVVALLTSYFILGTGILGSSTTKTIQKDIINQRDNILIDDLETERSDFYKCVDNTSMYWRVQSINCFQSSVSPSIMQFYKKVGIRRDVASRPDFSAYGLRPFFSTKYYFDYNLDNTDTTIDKSFVDNTGAPKMPGWKYLKTCNNFDIYIDENYVPMGYCFDSYVTEEEFERVREKDRPQAVVYAMVLTRDQMRKYADITGYTDEKYAPLYGEKPDSFKSTVDNYTYGTPQLQVACDKLKSDACSKFEYTDDGFRAEYTNKGNDKLLFFTVPYSEGFTAEVNGKPVDVEKVDYGFMAVRVPGNTKSDIVFRYRTPGLDLGVKISLCALAAFAVYMLTVLTVFIVKKVRRSGRSNVRDNWRDI